MTENLHRVLTGTAWDGCKLAPLTGDASARRYLRVIGERTPAILMDARKEPAESTRAFCRISAHLTSLGLSAPQIHLNDPSGILVIEDFGDKQFARVIARDPEMEQPLYRVAVDVLAVLHQASLPQELTHFDAATMAAQACLAYDCYAAKPKGADTTFRTELQALLTKYCTDPPVLILRDYHAENLMWLGERHGVQRAGLLDFQDAMAGPVGYDLASLLTDARRDVSPDLSQAMTQRFTDKIHLDPDDFAPTLAVLSAQRCLRILGVFARLSRTQGKPHYIDLIPRVWRYLTDALRHPDLSELRMIVECDLPEPTADHLDRLRHPC